MRPTFVVDLDGTLIEEKWPELGDWLPGAIEALQEMTKLGKTVIYSLRCSPYELDNDTPRADGAVEAEQKAIRAKLDSAGLYDVEIHPNGRGKPPGRFYIDDRAIRFEGDWEAVLRQIRRLQSHV